MHTDSFGIRCTAHVLLQRHERGRWGEARLLESAPLALSPLTQALHYGQSIFEGFKAHRQPDGSLALFRPRDHLLRLNRSAQRLCIPTVDPDELLARIVELVRTDAGEAPAPPESLYVRPIVFADEARLGAGVAASYTLLVMLVPVRALFASTGGIRLRTETRWVRAASGGTGNVKYAGNYAPALLAQNEARAEGFDEVLWLDARERRWVEETSSMNLMLARADALSTPPLTDTILPGMTRDSLLQLARDAGIPAEEHAISTDTAEWRDVSEAFSAGTAAGTAHIREIVHEGRVLFARATPGPLALGLGERLERIKFGLEPDPHEWVLPVR